MSKKKTGFLIAMLAAIFPFSCKEMTDEEYFRGREALQVTHFEEAKIYKAHFKPKNALLCGVGMGQRVYALNVVGVDASGFDISEYAVEQSPYKGVLKEKLFVGDITKIDQSKKYDLVVAFDVLEHLTPEQLEAALAQMRGVARKDILISVPVIGDPNLDKDPTHIIKETMAWWLKKISSFGFKIVPTPDHFWHKQQIILAKPG